MFIRVALAMVVNSLAVGLAGAQSPSTAPIERGMLPTSWVTGGACPETPVFHIREYNPDSFILRQSGCSNFEKPFLYLLFGGEARYWSIPAPKARTSPVRSTK